VIWYEAKTRTLSLVLRHEAKSYRVLLQLPHAWVHIHFYHKAVAGAAARIHAAELCAEAPVKDGVQLEVCCLHPVNSASSSCTITPVSATAGLPNTCIARKHGSLQLLKTTNKRSRQNNLSRRFVYWQDLSKQQAREHSPAWEGLLPQLSVVLGETKCSLSNN
jgi:hypothetical protein